MKQLNNIFPIIIFLALSFVIIFPLLPPGYILTLDMIPTPKVFWPSFTSPSFIFESVYAFFSLLISPYWLQKIILFLIFFLSGWGMYRLVPVKNVFIKVFAGIFYAVNPFVYERAMVGHWPFLLSYALFPFIILSVLDFFQDPNKIKAIKLSVLATVIFSITIHYTLIFALFFVIYGIVFCCYHQKKIISLTGYLVVFLGLVFLLNANWIIPGVLGKFGIAYDIAQFTKEDLTAFQSVPDKRFGLIFNLLSGYGFWPEVHSYFISPKKVNPFWPLFSVVFILTSIYGLVQLLKEKEGKLFPVVVAMVIMFLFSLDFAGGVALRSFAQTAFWLYQKFTPLRGFREPQKLVSNLMFCYAFLGSFGLYALFKKVKENYKYILLVFFMILPFIYTPTIFGGFWGQLKPVFYPASWQKVNEILEEDKDKFLTLFFPWHQYMRFKFNNNLVIANPAPYYFDKPILSSENYETKFLYTHDTRPEALHVDGLLTIELEGKNLLGERVDFYPKWGRDLAAVDIKYIILAKDGDLRNYKFVERESDFKKIYEDEDLILYQNLAWGKEIELPSEIEAQPETEATSSSEVSSESVSIE